MKTRVIAEIGCNHMGRLKIAEEMIFTAGLFCKVWAVKLQKRNPKLCLSEEQYNASHPNPSHSFGSTYGEHREYLEFDPDQHNHLRHIADVNGLSYGVSVWDEDSLKEMARIKPAYIKIPSACNEDKGLIGLASEYDIPLHISLGMLTPEEVEGVEETTPADAVLYACTSGYPVTFDELYLREIVRLKCHYGWHPIGFSGHHLGIAADIAAMVYGAKYIERHFTLDRTQKGTDHSASLEPDGMRRLVRDLENVEKALRYKPYSSLSPIELDTWRKLKC